MSTAEIREYIRSHSLRESVREISSTRLRELYGQNSLMLRTLGDRFQGTVDYQRTYFDEARGKEVMTEFAEFLEALREYDRKKDRSDWIDLVLEAGDILYQSIVLDLNHQGHEQYMDARAQMDYALNYVERELAKRGLSMGAVRKMARIKYGVRCWRKLRGLEPKAKSLEKRLCREELNHD